MKTLNQSASKRNEAMAATRIATQLRRMLPILPSAILFRGWMGGYREGQGCASYAFMIFSRVIGRSVEEEVLLILLFWRSDVFEAISMSAQVGKAHVELQNELKLRRRNVLSKHT
jgi:hypothetical protein